MKDFEFGERIYNLRKQEGLSQHRLASLLGISNKAISKWENGDAKPSIEQLVKLSNIFNVSLEELLNKSKNKDTKTIHKIVVTGGPCAGKSTAMSWIQTEFSKKGYTVLFVPETATELIMGGISPYNIEKNIDFEIYILKLQLEKEKIFEEAARKITNDKVLIVYDRGCLDCKAYMTPLEFNKALDILKTNEIALRDNYDAVFHLTSAAKGAEEFYTKANNLARRESLDEAISKDSDTLNAWIGHPHLRVIDNTSNFEDKMRRLITEISSFIGEPEPYEIERKFLIEYPNLEKLIKMNNCQKVEIIQTYLNTNGQDEVRIRQRGLGKSFTYTKTVKKRISDIKRIETESRISKDDYLSLLLDADITKRQIRKTRYCLMYKSLYFEIDIYPFWNDKAIMEIELRDKNQEIIIPSFIKIIKEVTNDVAYFNSNLASKNI